MGRLNKLSDKNLDSLRDQSIGSLLTAFSPPAPASLTAVGGDGIATLSWVPSSTLSQLPISDHEIQVSTDGTTWTTFSDGVGTSPSVVVTGLTVGSSYFFRVRSKNSAGVGAYTTTPSAISVGLPPSAPTGLAATAGERRVTLSWSVPSSDGGVAISDYQIEYSVDSGTTWTAVTRSAASTATSYAVTNLLGQVPHQFRVRAVNGIAPGAWSTEVTATPASYDEYWDDVSLLLKMEGSGTTFVDSSPNNTAITSFGVSQSTTQKKWGTKSADIAATNSYLSVADGPSTSMTGAFTIEMWMYWKKTPTSEQFLFHGANNGSTSMSFLTLGSNGQGLRYGRSYIAQLFSTVPAQFLAGRWYHIAVVREADFRIRLFVDGVQINQSTTLDLWSGSAAISGRLFIGWASRSADSFIDEFRITKRARYSANFTPPAEPFPTGKRPSAPTAPAAPTAAIGDGELTASWTAVAGATSYVVEYQPSGGAWSAGGTAPSNSLVLTGLENGETYTVRVAAVNAVGASVWATAAAVTLLTPPAQVTGLTAAAGHLQACLSWNAPDGDITDYSVQFSDDGVWQTFAHPESKNTFITVTGLTNGVSYQFRVAARNTLVTGAYSTIASATPSLSLPAAPTALTSASGNGLVSLAWTEPASTSCRVLTNYIVSYSSNSGSSWTDLTPSPATSATATVSGLTNGVSYVFRVAHQSAAGTGPWSEASAAVTPAGPPSPPVSVSGTAGDGQVVVSWVAGNDGGSPATDYLLQYSTNQTAWTQIDDGRNILNYFTVTGLTNGTAYYFRVSTRTAVGDSVPSQSAAITPRGVPGAPGTPSGTASAGQVSLTWTAAAANGSPVTGYTVEYTPAGGSPQTVATNSASASYTVTGLTNGTSYTFRVRAVNAVGAGAFGAASSPATPSATPGVPTGFAGTAGINSVALSWTAPADTGGSAITNYTVEYTPAGGSALTATVSASPYTLTGLTNGTAYSIRVAANNAVGRGAYTAALSRTPATTPGTPTGVTVSGGSASGRLVVNWTAPSTGGSALIGYTFEYTPSGGSPQSVNTYSTATSYNLDGLTNGTSYSVRVRAQNSVGVGSYSAAAAGTPEAPATAPGTPTGLTATRGSASGRLALAWTAPSTGGSAITGYTVEYTPSGGSAQTVNTGSNATSYNLDGLTNGTSHSVRVRATNSVGSGSYSASASGTPGTVPEAPTSLTGTAGSRVVALSWTAPANTGGLSITSYTVQYTPSGGSAQTVSTGNASTSYTLTGLTNGTAYSIRVAAVNAAGQGAFSSASSFTPVGAADPLFSNVALLLRMDGNGSTFVDSSATQKAITAVGAATQSSAQSKWGGKSLALNGSDANLSLSSAGLTLAEDFVVEAWLYLSSVSTYAPILETRSSGGYSDFVCGVYNVNGSLRADLVTAGGLQSRLTGSSTTVPLNSWAHVAFVRSNGMLSVYVNGTRDATQYAYHNALIPQSSTMLIGRTVDGVFTNGFIDDLRITIGNDRGYTGSTITVPTEAFPDGAIFAPTSLTATAGNAEVSLAWTAPSYNGGSAITDYSVQYSTNSGSTWTTVTRGATTTASHVVGNLTNGTAYVFRVAGINANGIGTYTAASSSVTPVWIALTVSPTSGTADEGTAYSWSGVGTAESPLETSDALAPNGITWTWGYGENTFKEWQFFCLVPGTLTFELGAGNDNDGNPERTTFSRYLRNEAQSTDFVGTYTNVGTYYIRRSISVSAGDVIRLGRRGATPGTGFFFDPDVKLKGKIRLWIA